MYITTLSKKKKKIAKPKPMNPMDAMMADIKNNNLFLKAKRPVAQN